MQIAAPGGDSSVTNSAAPNGQVLSTTLMSSRSDIIEGADKKGGHYNFLQVRPPLLVEKMNQKGSRLTKIFAASVPNLDNLSQYCYCAIYGNRNLHI